MAEICVKCKIEFESFLMKNGKPSKKCLKHYEMQQEAEKRRPKELENILKKKK